MTTDDGTVYTAKVIGTDPKTDLALIKVDGKNDFPHVKLAEHAPRIGDWVVAVGNPFGLPPASSLHADATSAPALTTTTFKSMPRSTRVIPADRRSTSTAT